MAPTADLLSTLEHISSLESIKEELLSLSAQTRSQCLYYYKKRNSRCSEICRNIVVTNPKLYKQVEFALLEEEVSAEEFSKIIRTLFCGLHLRSNRFNGDGYKGHFGTLWEKAAQDRRSEVLEAFRDYHKNPTKACVTTEEKEQLRSDLENLVENPNEDTEQLSPSPRSFMDSETDSELCLGTDDIKVGRDLKSDSPMSADYLTLPQAAQYELNQSSVRPKITPQPSEIGHSAPQNHPDDSKNNISSSNKGVSTASDLSEKIDFPSGSGPNIFPPSAKHETTNECVSSLEELRTPSSKTSSEFAFEFGKSLRYEFGFITTPLSPKSPADRFQTRNFGTTKFGSGTKTTRMFPSRAPLGHESLPPRPSTARPSPSRRPEINSPSRVPSGPTVLPLRPSTARPSPAKRPENITNFPGHTTLEQSCPTRAKDFSGLAEHSSVEDSPRIPDKGEAQPSPVVRPVISASPSSAQNTEERFDGLQVEKPRDLTQEIQKLLLQPFEPPQAKVYVLRAPKYFKDQVQCVKIGISANVKQRMKTLSAECGFTDLEECPGLDVEARPKEWALRVEKLCHKELEPFLRIVGCTEGKDSATHKTNHREWFAVPESVAVHTVKRWLRFIDLMPHHGQERNGVGVKDVWHKHIRELRVETTPHSSIRYEQLSEIYDTWLEDAANMI